ncbi:MAG: T9SS type A sorting domain-containing protein [Bacteroidales bacterium]|jgi:hypothetical protein|nr:T9SS type A sorting domain-containing protein [Bacteroidales bacterium]
MKKLIFLLNFFVFITAITSAQTWKDYLEVNSSGNVRILSNDIDENDNIYIAGHFQNSIGDTINSNGGFDFFIAKISSDLQPVWIKTIGGKGNELLYIDLKLDQYHNIFVTGIFQDTCYFNENQDSLISDAGSYDVFLAKYNINGSFLWSKKIAWGESTQYINGIDIDKSNNIILVGDYVDSLIYSDDTLRGTGTNNYIFKLDDDGNYLWVDNILNSSGTGKLTSISAFNDGYYFNGIFLGDLYLDVKTISSYITNKSDVYLYKTDFDGNGLWVRQSYGNNNDYTGTITQDDYGNIYFTGYFSGTEFYADSTETLTSNVILSTSGSNDIFIHKYNKNGNLLWSRGYGGIGNDVAKVILSRRNKLYISGYFSDELVFGDDTINSSSSSDLDIYVAGLDNLGNTLFASSLYGEGGVDQGDILEISSDGINTFGGAYRSASLQIGEGTLFNSTGTYNGILAQFIPELNATFTKKTNPTCYGSTDGELVVTPYFGVSPYTYAWNHDPGLNDSTATGLSAGTYSVTVTDALDSSAIALHTLAEPDSFLFNPSVTHVTTCSYSGEGEIDISVTGGNGGNTYYWFESEGGSGVSLTSEDQTGLTAGTYCVTVTDAEGCTADTAIILTGPKPVTFGESVVTHYTGPADLGAIDLVYQGGTGTVTFSWEGPSGFTAETEDIADLDPGSYSVTATDNNGCVFDTTFNVLDQTTFYAYISHSKDACPGTTNGKATVSYFSVDGHTDITYQWDANAGGQTTAEAINLASGQTYSVTVTDVEAEPDLVDVVNVTIGELGYTFAGEITPSSTSLLDCYGDTDGYIDVHITTAGEMPYSYSWNTGATTQDLTNVGIGTYSITVTDANECEFTVTGYEITQPTEVLATAEVVNSPTCHGDYDGELTVLRSGGTEPYSYLWNDPGSQSTQIADGLDAGFYTVTVTDANGCHKSSSVNLTQPPAIQVNKTVYNVSCNGGNDGAVQLAVSGGTPTFSYFWTTDNGSGLVPTQKDQSGLTPGTYSFTATDAHNCMYEDSVVITEPAAPLAVELTEVTDALCNGAEDGTINVTATGGTLPYIYAWTTSDGSGQVADVEDQGSVGAGTYDLIVVDDHGCEANLSVDVEEPAAITIVSENVTDASSESASDGSITVEAAGGTGTLSYTLTPGDVVNETGIFENLSPDDYLLEITDDNSCGPVTTNLTVGSSTSVEFLNVAGNIRIYPNPTSNHITVEIAIEQQKKYALEILNISGQRVYHEVIETRGKLKKKLDLSDYAKGIYFVRVSTEGSSYQEKVIFQ